MATMLQRIADAARAFRRSPTDDFWYVPTGTQSVAGIAVNGERALSSTGVLAAVRILSEAVAQLPLHIYERAGGKKSIVENHPLQAILHDSPCPELTSFEFREMMMGSLLCYGNAFAEIERGTSGNVIALWPLPGARTQMRRDVNGDAYCETWLGANRETIPRRNVLHLRGFCTYGLMGLDLIRTASSAIGLAMAQEEYSARHYGNGAMPSSIVSRPAGAPRLDDQGRSAIRNGIKQLYGGLSNAGRVALLEEGMEWKPAGISPKDSQLIEGKKFSITDIARIFLIPPPMLMELDRATFTNIESQGISFVVYTLMSWLRRWEQRIGLDLLAEGERKRYFAEFLVDGLMRGDAKTRYEAYASAIQNGWMSRNEVRDKENLDPVDGGDELLFPVNLAPVSKLGDLGGGDAPQQDGDNTTNENSDSEDDPPEAKSIRAKGVDTSARKKARDRFRPLFEQAYKRLAKREEKKIMDAAQRLLLSRAASDFDEWLKAFEEEDAALFEEFIGGVLRAYGSNVADLAAADIGAQITEEIDAILSKTYNGKSRSHALRMLERMKELIDAGDAEGTIKALGESLKQYTEEGYTAEAGRRVTQTDNAVARIVWKSSGVTKLRWQSDGSPCPLCATLAGQVVGIDSNFVNGGEKITVDGKVPLQVSQHGVLHPPLHKGCCCFVVPEFSA